MKTFGRLGKSLRAVLWSFFGVRQSHGLQDDMATLSPLHLIGVGIGLCFLFVLGLLMFVQWMVKI